MLLSSISQNFLKESFSTGKQQVYTAGGDFLIEAGRPAGQPRPIQNTFFVHKVCLLDPIGGLQGVFLFNNRLLGARLRDQVFQIPGPLSPDPSDVSIH